ncbi:hypothetical protein [Halobacillus sp. B23F22_1]|uniref:hypothetical protein n=1 Tax=Halobacillus sp. B23F22_1 TaxID=3459514 RepID=UPI00373F3766
MFKKWFIIISFVLLLDGCDATQIDSNVGLHSSTKEIGFIKHMMPEQKPDDFGFSVQFGVNYKNEVNSFEDQVTKDLIAEGAVTADIAFSPKENDKIYEKMKEMNIVEKKKLTPEQVSETICTQEPHEEDIWRIIIEGETITHSVSGAYCEPTHDAQKLIELRNYVFSIVRSKEEFKELPLSKASYE